MATPRLEYRGIDFGDFYASEASVAPVYDESRRMRIALRLTLTVDAWICGVPGDGEESACDDLLDAMIGKLSEPGGEFMYVSHGLGEDIHINGASEIKSSNWGPHPVVLDFKPLGGYGNAARVKWRCEVEWPICSDGSVKDYEGMMALNYTTTHAIDGVTNLTTETVRGHMIRALTRPTVDARTFQKDVDQFREKLEARKPLPEFQRTNFSVTGSHDHRRLDFEWTDVELPHQLPHKVTKVNARQKIKPRTKWGVGMWDMTLTATYTVPRGLPKYHALQAFLHLLKNKASQPGVGDFGVPKSDGKGGGGADIHRTYIEVDDDIYGLQVSFTAHVEYLKRRRLDEILKDTRMWEPTGTRTAVGFSVWKGSLKEAGVESSRGGAGMKIQPDVLIDLCEDPGDRAMTTQAPAKKPPDSNIFLRPDTVYPNKPTKLPAAWSWVNWSMWFRWVSEQGVVLHQPLPPEPVQPSSPPPDSSQGLSATRPFPQGEDGTLSATTAASNYVPALKPFPASRPNVNVRGGVSFNEGRSPSLPPALAQKASSARRFLQVVGVGIRVGHRVTPPKIISVGGASAVLLNEEFSEVVLGRADQGAVYCTVWRLTYAIPSAPTGPLPAPANPMASPVGGGGGETGGDSLATSSPNFIGD